MTLLTAAAAAQTPVPPVAPQVPHLVKSPHGDRSDEYHWLRDDDPQGQAARDPAPPGGRERLHRGRDGAAAAAARQLVAEMRSRIQEDDSTPPVYDHGWWYWREFKPGGRISGADAPARHAPSGPTRARRARCCSTSPALAAGHGLLPRRLVRPSAPMARCWPGPRTPAAAASTRCASATCAPARPTPTRSPACWRTWPGPTTTARLFYIRQDPVTLQSGPVWRHALGTRTRRRRQGVRGGGQDALRRRRPQRLAPIRADRGDRLRHRRDAGGAGRCAAQPRSAWCWRGAPRCATAPTTWAAAG